METSARNTFWGTISSVRPGAVNDEIELTMPSGTKLVASITKASTERLGLAEGRPGNRRRGEREHADRRERTHSESG